jgi:uncharacterized protein (DUF433 family)
MKLPDFLVENRFGEITIVGHRVGLYSLVRRHKEGASAVQLGEEYPTLPKSLIEQVLNFYAQNSAEVDVYVKACRDEIDRQAAKAEPGPGLTELKDRWTAQGLGKLP